MAAKIYDFPVDIGIDESEDPIMDLTDEEITKAYDEYHQFEEDEFIYNQYLQDQKRQKEKACSLHKLLNKIISRFQ